MARADHNDRFGSLTGSTAECILAHPPLSGFCQISAVSRLKVISAHCTVRHVVIPSMSKVYMWTIYKLYMVSTAEGISDLMPLWWSSRLKSLSLDAWHCLWVCVSYNDVDIFILFYSILFYFIFIVGLKTSQYLSAAHP